MLNVRRMQLEDVPAAAVIERSAPDPWNEKQLAEELASEFARNLVLCEVQDGAERILGLCSAQTAADEATLNAITVDPAARGRGCGAFLLNALLRELAAEGVAEVYLEVRTRNAPAIALYEKTGFVRTGVRKRFYKAPPDDAITMKKDLSSVQPKGTRKGEIE